MRFPEFSDDNRLVAGYTMPGTEIVSRLLIPLPLSCGHWFFSWREVSGRPIDGSTRLSNILPRRRRCDLCQGALNEVEAPSGWIDAKTVSKLTHAFIATETEYFMIGVSRVYGEKYSFLPEPLTLPTNSLQFFETAQLDLFRVDDVSVFAMFTAENQLPFPCAVWPADLSWSLAAWVYSDSWFFSGSRQAFSAFETAGLELRAVSREQEMMAEGD